MGSLGGTQSLYIRRINVLSEYDQSDHAMYLIRKAASLVLPIMKKRNYTIGTLTEFWDRPPGWRNGGIVLGWNRNNGETIALRLRKVHDHTVFLELESIIQTILHELCHNIWNGHDNNFYALLKQHEWEFEQLALSGFTGDQSVVRDASHLPEAKGASSEAPAPPPAVPEIPVSASEGRTLGGRLVPDREEARRIALVAAENRRRIQEEERQRKARARKQALKSYQMLAGNRLGSKPPEAPIRLAGKPVQTSDREKIAEAAERRRRDAVACGSGGANAGTRRQQLEDTIDKGIQNGIQVTPDPISPDEMAAILLQIQVLEEAEQLWKSDHEPQPPPFSPTLQGKDHSATSNSSTSNTLAGSPGDKTVSNKPATIESSGQSQFKKPLPKSSTAPPVGSSQTRDLPVGSPRKPSSISCSPSSVSRPTKANHGPLWPCSACTLINSANHTKCSLCDTPRGGNSSAGTTAATDTIPSRVKDKVGTDQWQCHQCKTLVDNEWWTCTKCGIMKISS